MVRGLEERAAELQGLNDALLEQSKKAQEMIEASKHEIASARKTANAIVLEAEDSAKKITDDAKKDAAQRLASAKETIAELGRISREEMAKEVADAKARKERIESEASALEAESAAFVETKKKNDALSIELAEKEQKLEDVKKQLASILSISKEQ